MRKMGSRKFFLIVIIAISYQLSSISAKAQVGLNKLAQSTMNFQLVSVSPKASAMGEAYGAFGAGADAVFFNPAGLADINNKFNAVINYTQWIADINYYAAAVSWNLESYGVVGLNALSVDYGTILGTSLDLQKGYIDNGELQNVGAYSFGLSYAKAISKEFMVGGNARYVGQNLGENTFNDGTFVKNNATKFVVDFGVKYYTNFNDFRLGMAIRNFSSDITREVYSEQLPLIFIVGGAIDLLDFMDSGHDKNTSLTLAADFVHPNNYSERINTGIEYKFLGILSLRGGYQTNRDVQSWSAGVGFNTTVGGTTWEINYSFSKMDIFSNVNRFSIQAAF